jgi:hypothetical protein
MNNTHMKTLFLRLDVSGAEHAPAYADTTRMLRRRWELASRCRCDQPGSKAGLLPGGEGWRSGFVMWYCRGFGLESAAHREGDG